MFRNAKRSLLLVIGLTVFLLPSIAAAKPFDNLPLDKMPLDKIPLDKVPFAYSELYILGDSLSDVGNIFIASGGTSPAYPYYEGRFSNGPNFTEYLADIYMLLNDPSLAGGTNFAWGGARTGWGTAPSGLEQLGDYLAYAAADTPDEDALFIVFLGGNNLRDIIMAAAAPGVDSAAIIQSGVAQSMEDMMVILGGLIQAGADNIAVPNVPNMGNVPGVSLAYGGALIPMATAASQAYNMALEMLLQAFDGQANILRVDVYGLFDEMVADPASYGLTNATHPCLFEVAGEMTVCPNPDEYLFWDLIHPTAVGHVLLGDAVFEAVRQGLLPAAVRKQGR